MTQKKKPEVPKESTDSRYYTIAHNLNKGVVLNGIPADSGVLIPADSFTFNVTKDRFDKLVRQHGLAIYKGKNRSECGVCGLYFIDDRSRDAHGERSHSKPRYNIVNIDDLTEQQKAQLKADAGQPGLSRKDPDYWVRNNEFSIPDPQEGEFSRQDRQLTEAVDWTKTEASRRG